VEWLLLGLSAFLQMPRYNKSMYLPENPSEKRFALEAIKRGCGLHRAGWPDFIVRVGEEVFFVEVKLRGDAIRPDQERTFSILEHLGLKVRISVNGEFDNLLTVEEYHNYITLSGFTKRQKDMDASSVIVKEKILEFKKKA